MPQGLQHCGRANRMHSKPQRSWPTRAHLCTANPSGLGQQGHETLQASCIVWLQASAVSAIKGTRHCGRAASLWQLCKRCQWESAQPYQKLPLQEEYFAGKSTARASTSILRLTRSATIACKKSNGQEGEVCSVDGAPLKEREKGGASG
jgi:hypothetical protein